MAKVLIIDDDEEMCSMLADLVSSVGHSAKSVRTLDLGRKNAVSGDFDVVFLDVKMPGGNGLDLMPDIMEIHFPPEIIVITGQGDLADAEKAIRNGAWDYIQKPLSPKKIIDPLNKILQYRDGIRSVSRPLHPLIRDDIIGSSRQIQECLNMVAKAGECDSNVLITGETGTGKELFARAIHRNSGRSGNRFVVVDCAALTESLVEAALFGHEKGAFTGADKKSVGLVSLADKGTLFLDEVGEMNLGLQKVFLRVIQEHRFRPVGSKTEEQSNFRVIAATNRVPDQMVAQGLFRQDLLYRLNAISLELPPLRERLEDIESLIEHMIQSGCENQNIPLKDYSQDFVQALKQHTWPGNIRQLANVISSALTEALYEPVLFPKHLPESFRVSLAKSSVIVRDPKAVPPSFIEPIAVQTLPTYKEVREIALAQAEKEYLKDLMMNTRGDIKKACELSGLGRSRLYSLMKKNDVDRMGWN